MAEQGSIEQYLFRIAVTETEALSAKAAELALKEYPTEGAYKLLNAVQEIAGAIREEVELLHEQVPEGGLSLEDKIEYISLPIRLIQYLHGMLDYVEKANTESNPYGIAAPFFSLVSKLQDDTQIIMRPQWEYMYSLVDAAEWIRNIVENCLTNPRILNDDFPKWLLVLSYPATHKQSGLMHVIQAHEVGHFFDDTYDISSRVLSAINPEALGLEDLADTLAKNQIGHILQPDLFYQAALETNRASFRRLLLQILKDWISEMVADEFAIRVSGPAYFFAMADFSLSVGPLTFESNEHPRPVFRLSHLLKDIEELGYKSVMPPEMQQRIDYWSEMLADLRNQENNGITGTLEKVLSREPPGVGLHISQIVAEELAEKGIELIPKQLKEELHPLISLLEAFIPPVEILDSDNRRSKPANLFSAINAGWTCYITRLDDLAKKFGGEATESNKRKVVSILNRHLLKAIEVNQLCLQLRYLKDPPSHNSPLLNSMYDTSKPIGERLVITPMLRASAQVEGYSIDVRLGSEFILPVRSRFPVFDPDLNAPSGRYASGEIERYQERVYRPYGKQFVLNPGEFVLGSTLEYIQLPGDMTAYITGRSSWGRLGLNIATATAVAPGYSGVLTLELVNHGNAPLMLSPGTRIAQLNFFKLPEPVSIYANRSLSKYRFPTTVGFSRIRDDNDWRDLKSIIRNGSS